MEKSIKMPLYLFGLFILFVVLHNAMYGIFGIEEPVFFTLALLSALGFAISIIYALIAFIIRLIKKEFKSKKRKLGKSERAIIKYYWAVLIMILGMTLNYLKLGVEGFVVFGRVGTYLIYIGFIGLIIVTLQTLFWKRKRKVVDERMEFVATKALRVAFLVLLVVAFIVIIVDGIKPITMPYHLFMSYLISGILIVYVIAYRILLRFH